jgi:hypothetical protein
MPGNVPLATGQSPATFRLFAVSLRPCCRKPAIRLQINVIGAKK